jgi:SPP1 gp7 family putative phage head morphogenesis protein
MKNRDYWRRRAEILEAMKNQNAGNYTAVGQQFNLAQKTLDEQIEQWYARFAKNNQITITEARQWLAGKDLAEFKWDVTEYIKYGKENAINQQWAKQLENASARFHVSKLEALKLKTQATVEQLYGQTAKQTTSLFGKIYTDNYYHTAFELQKGVGVGWDVASLNPHQIESVLSNPWTTDKQTFSDRIWKQKNDLLSEVHTQLTQNMILGKAPDDAIKAISKKFNTSKSNAGRLVMTESAYFATEAQRKAFETLDVEEYEIVATLDSLTSAICQSMDGEHFPMSQFEPGVTAPPFHPWCRSAVCPYFADDDEGERIARGADGKTYYVPSDMKYKEWKEKFVDGGDESDIIRASGKVGDTDGYTRIDSIQDVNFVDSLAVKKEVERFCDEFAYSDVEHALEISPNGKAYSLTGGSVLVNAGLVGAEALGGSIGIHNHPVPPGEDMYDSFSLSDLKFAAAHKQGKQYLISGKRRNAFEFTSEFTEEEIYKAWHEALQELWRRAKKGEIAIVYEQEQVLRILDEMLEGFVFYENF